MQYSYLSLLAILIFKINPLLAFDSLRVDQRNGKDFIVHPVESKETLYGISKRYNTSTAEIVKYNEGITAGLKIYQELFIPIEKVESQTPQRTQIVALQKFHIVQVQETLFGIAKLYGLPVDSLVAFNNLDNFNIATGDILLLARADTDTEPTKKNTAKDSIDAVVDPRVHVVAKSETLYSISKMYDVRVDELTKWNKLSTTELYIGQQLHTRQGSISNPNSATEPLDYLRSTPKTVTPDTLFVQTNSAPFKGTTEESAEGTKIVQQGFAMKIDMASPTKKYLALHRNAPVGSTLEVKNEMNGRIIFARVVGKLPDTGLNKNVLIRLSGAAFAQLGALDAKIPVTASYIEK